MGKRIVVVGAGAIGGIAGGHLTRAGHDVTMIDPWPEHVETMREHGLHLSGMTPEETHVVKVNAIHLTEVQQFCKQRPVDIAFICVKSYDTEWATHLIKPYLAPDGFCVSLQNCINEERIAAIVGSADLLAPDDVDALLDAHVAAGEGLFRGIRHAAAWDASDAIRPSHHHPPPHLYLNPTFRRGFAKLAERGLTFDAWLFHPQIPELTDLARAFPEASLILDHLGGPLGIGPYAGKRDEYFPKWRSDMAGLATCPNVTVKLGGMAMPINGWDWHKTGAPDSIAFAAAQGDWYRAAIDLFGPDRCMFESNFPVDRASLSYRTLWNGLKRIAAPYSEAEKDLMFRGTAARVYGIEDEAG